MGATFDAVASQVWRRQQCKMSNDFESRGMLSFRVVHGPSSGTLPILRQLRRRTWPFLTPRYEGAMFGLSIFWQQACGVIKTYSFWKLALFVVLVLDGFDWLPYQMGNRCGFPWSADGCLAAHYIPFVKCGDGLPSSMVLGPPAIPLINRGDGLLPAWCTDLRSAHYTPIMAMGCFRHWIRVFA